MKMYERYVRCLRVQLHKVPATAAEKKGRSWLFVSNTRCLLHSRVRILWFLLFSGRIFFAFSLFLLFGGRGEGKIASSQDKCFVFSAFYGFRNGEDLHLRHRAVPQIGGMYWVISLLFFPSDFSLLCFLFRKSATKLQQ